MRFGEKVRQLRTEKKLSQTELGKLCGLSLRTIRNYEVAGRYPKKREVYSKLAFALGCSINYLLAENEDSDKADLSSVSRVESLINEISSFFADSEISNDDKDSVMRSLKASYSIAKKRRRKPLTVRIRRRVSNER